MKFLNKERVAWLIAIIILIVLLTLSKFGNNPLNTTKEINSYLIDSTKKEKVRGIEVSTIHQALLETQDQIKELIKSNDTLKKLVKDFKIVNSITKVKTETFLKDSIQYKEIPCDFNPIKRIKETPEYRLALTIGKFGTDVELKIPNTISFIEGKRKIGLFKTEQQIMAVNSNPLVQTKEIQSMTVKSKKKWWERPGPWVIVGAVLEESARQTIKQFIK